MAHTDRTGGGKGVEPPAPEEGAAHRLHLQQVGGAGHPQGQTGGEHHQVPVLEDMALLQGGLDGGGEEGVGVRLLGAHHRDDAPGDGQLPVGDLVGGAADDGDAAPVLAHHPGGAAGFGDRDDSRRPNVQRGGAGGVADGVGDVAGDGAGIPAAEPRLVVDVPLGAFRHGGHGLQRLQGVLPGGGLPGEHDGAGAVIDGVGHVVHLRPGGTGMGAHALQHLGGGDDHLAGGVALADHHLLQDGDLLHIHLDPQVAPGHHDPPGDRQDLVQVLDPFGVLDLGDDLDVAPAVLPQKVLDGKDVLGAADKGRGHKIEPLPDAEEQVGLVSLAEVRDGQGDPGDVDALVVGNLPAVFDGAVDIGILDALHHQFHQAVVDEDTAAGGDIAGQPGIGDGADGGVPHHLPGGDGEALPGGKDRRAAFKIPEPYLRPLGVQQGGDGKFQFLPQALHGR